MLTQGGSVTQMRIVPTLRTDHETDVLPRSGIPTCELQSIGIMTGQTLGLCWNSSTRKTSQVEVVDKPIWSTPPAFSVSRDGRLFLWNQTDHHDSDLVLRISGEPYLKSDKSIASPIALYPASPGCR